MTKDDIIELRKLTGAGLSDVREALEEAAGDKDKAIEVLRRKGALKAAKRAGRTASEGVIGHYVHSNGKSAALVRLNCETDFVARNKDFKELAHDLAMQVVAVDPDYLKPEDIPEDVLNKEKEIYKEQLKAEGKPDKVIDKILEGKLQKFYSEVCLLNQPFIKDDKKTVQDLIDEATGKIGEKIEISGFEKLSI